MEFNPNYAYIPLQPGTKLPATRHGVKDAQKPPLSQWDVSRYKDWGIACGKISGLVVLDIDVKSGGLETLKAFEEQYGEGLLQCTYTVRTASGGYHLYFSLQAGQEFKNLVGFMPGWDLRCDNGYVKVYNDVISATAPIPMPEQIIELIKESSKKTSQAVQQNFEGNVAEGGRNHYLTRIAGQLQRKNLLTFEGLSAINERDCSPPLDDDEVHIIYNSVSRYVPEAPIEADVTGELLSTRIGDLKSQVIEFINDKEKVKGEPTLLEGLDDLLGGGHRLGEVTCWHAEAKTGKNTLWHKLMHLWMTRKEGAIPIGYASRELTPETEVIPDLLSIEYQRNIRLMKEDVSKYTSVLDRWPLYFANGYGHFPFDQIVQWIQELKPKGVQYFWFDHLHYMLEDPEDHKEASKLIKNIKSLAKQENINVQIIIQPNKLMDGQKLSLNSIKGGAAMGQAIDNLIILERVRSETPNIMMLKTQAVRSKLAKSGKIYLQYNPQTIDMIEMEPEEALQESGQELTYGNQTE